MQSQVEIATIREFESRHGKRGGASRCEPVRHVHLTNVLIEGQDFDTDAGRHRPEYLGPFQVDD
jgi:hypothetical protein